MVEGVIGGTAQISIQIVGLPEPNKVTLQRVHDDTDLELSSRHSVRYTAGVAPYGSVEVNIFNLVEADFTLYVLTVDNDEGNPLLYPFYLQRGELFRSGSFFFLLFFSTIVASFSFFQCLSEAGKNFS